MPNSLTDMGKYLLAFALSYVAALLVFAALGTVSLFRWPVGPVPAGFSVCWTLFPLAAAFVLGLCFARHWAAAVGTQSRPGLVILLVVMSMLVVLARQVEALQPLTAPGRMFGTLFLLRDEILPLTFVGSLLYPAAFQLGWRLGG